MYLQNKSLPLLTLILIAACSDAKDESLAPRTEQVQTGSSESIYLSDLDRSEPQSALSREWKRGTWQLLDYTAEWDPDDAEIYPIRNAFQQKPDASRYFSGTLLLATHGNQAPEITYSPDRSGWYRIYVGIYRKPFEESKAVDVRLSRDPAFTTLEGGEGGKDQQENWLDEVYWKTADLTGQDIHFRQITFPQIRHAWVAFIKLVPLSEDQVQEFETDRKNPEHRRLFVHTDPGIHNEDGSREVILSILDPLRHGDVARLYWETGWGDLVFYSSSIAKDPTQIAEHGDDAAEPFYPREWDRNQAKTWQAYRKSGIDPLAVVVEFAHQHDIELHAAYRMGGVSFRLLTTTITKTASSSDIRN